VFAFEVQFKSIPELASALQFSEFKKRVSVVALVLNVGVRVQERLYRLSASDFRPSSEMTIPWLQGSYMSGVKLQGFIVFLKTFSFSR
jgi:hypothetical protein